MARGSPPPPQSDRRRAGRGPGLPLVRGRAGDLRERRPVGSPGGRRERRRVALAETEARAPEAWARGRTARCFRSPLLQRAGSSEAFRARGEYRPAAIVIGSRLDIFSLKRRWGRGVGGRASGRGSASCRGPEGLWLQGGAEPLWALVAGFCRGRELGFSVTREEDGKAAPRPGSPCLGMEGPALGEICWFGEASVP